MPCRVDAFHSLFNCSHAKTKLFEVCRTVTVKYRDLLIKCDADSTRRKYRGFFNDSFFVVALCSCNHGSFSNELEGCVGIRLLLTGHVMQGQHNVTINIHISIYIYLYIFLSLGALALYPPLMTRHDSVM